MEQWKPLSLSAFWQNQANYYKTQDKSIWEETPHTVTNNAFIAKKMADICESISPESPVIEIGSGIGEFAYHFCKHRQKPFEFLCTDYTKINLQKLESLQDFNNWRYAYIHFHQLDCLNYQPIPVKATSFPIFIFNYVFDTLPHDGFIKIANNNIQTVLTCDAKNSTDHDLIHLSSHHKLPFRTEKRPIHPLIEDYIKSHWESAQQLTIPVGALNALAQIKKHHPKAIILFNDKTCQSPNALSYQDGFGLQKEGSVSCTVNTHAIRHLFQPDFLLETPVDPAFDLNISTGLLGWGFAKNETRTINNAWMAHQQNTIYDYALINRELALEQSKLSYPLIKRLLIQYNHDPYLFLNCTQNLYHHIHISNHLLHQDVRRILSKVKTQHFSQNERLIPAISSCYRIMNDISSSEALMRTYSLSNPQDYFYHKEMAQLQFIQKNHEEALAASAKALLIKSDCKQMHSLHSQIKSMAK
jgi:hypothetical protein